MAHSTLSHDEYTMAWMCALPLEMIAAKAMLDEIHGRLPQPQSDHNTYTLGRMSCHNIVIACLPFGVYGTTAAATALAEMRSTFSSLRFVLMVGIGGGAPRNADIRLGDVVVSRPTLKGSGVIPYDYGKTIHDGHFQRIGYLNKPPQVLLTAMSQIESDHREWKSQFKQCLDILEKDDEMKAQFSRPSNDWLFHATYNHCGTAGCLSCDPKQLVIRTPRVSHEPYIHYGLIASGNQVMRHAHTRDQIAQELGILCFEMEAAGLMDQLPCLVIRGICDYCDSHKHKQWQGYASLVAATYTKWLLSVVPVTVCRTQPERDPTSRVSAARRALKDHYIKGKRLRIERLSGLELPMDQCYINLAVVQCSRLAKSDANEQSKSTTSQQSSPFSLFSRLKIDAVGSGSLVSLDTLFEPQKQFNGEFVRPKRILVQGAAGVGKTTLCKKIVHDYYHHEMWQNLFDWLLWVPLRRLKLMSPVKECNLGRFFSDEYFSHYPEGKKFGQAMWEAVDTSARDKTLFILDGLDEVSGEWSSDTPMHKLLRDLLDMPQVIITTRPYRLSRTDLEPLDLELETIGFLPDQVAAYVQNPRIVRPKDTATQIQDFIQKHVLIRELVRIPIQLDALCHSWNGDFLKDMPRAMTTIYKAIVLKLWQKDIIALEIRHRGELLKKREAQDLLESEITNLTQNIMNLIEFLAFTGLYSDVIEFRAEVRKQIYNHKELCEKFPDMPDSILRKLSFLRTADETLGDDVRSYHFLHLTFQEFFAAQYFVTHWVEGKDLLCLPLWRARAKPSPKNPEKFLQEEKYNSRYDIFWRFVAGLLHEQGEDQLRRFFKILEDKPQDLLGPSHQRILMHCFSEVPRNSLEDLRIRVEGHLKQWALFENKIHGRMTLCHEMEFPDHVLHTMMKEEPEDVKKGILQALQYRPQLSSHLLKWIASFLGREKIAIDILRKQYTLPEDILHGIVARLEDSDCNVRQAASSVLDKQPTLSEGILHAIVTRLEHSHSRVRWSAINALGKQSALSEDILQAIATRLKDSDRDVRQTAFDVLGKQSTLSEGILHAIITQLEDSDWHIRSFAINTLSKQSTLSENILYTIVTQLEDTDCDVRKSAINALGKQSILSESILHIIVARLEDFHWDVRKAAFDVLGEQSTLSESVLHAIVTRLEHSRSSVRWSAIKALGKQSALSENIIHVMMARLEDSDEFVRLSTINALGQQSTLSESVLHVIVARLEDFHWDVRKAASDLLGEQSTLSESVLHAIVTRLEHSRSGVRWSAIKALDKQSALSENTLQAIISRLEDSDGDVRQSAVDALGKQSTLSESFLHVIAAQLDNSDCHMRRSAIRALDKQSALSEDILQAIVPRLEDSDWDVRWFVIKILDKQSTLSESILHSIITRLKHSNSDVRESAINALSKQSTLSENILHTITTQLGDSNSAVRWSTINVLSKQSTLSEDILYAIVIQLGHSDSGIRRSAITTLGKQSALSEDILQAIATQLDDSDEDVRRSAINVLGRQSALSDDILQAIVTRLEDSDRDVRWSAINALDKQTTLSASILQALLLSKSSLDIRSKAVSVLLKQDSLYNGFLTFDTKILRSIYYTLIRQSFSEQLSCYKHDGIIYIDLPDRRREISLVQERPFVWNKNAHLGDFRDEAFALGRPTSTAEDLKFMQTPWYLDIYLIVVICFMFL